MASSSSIASLVSVKLNRDNYLLWRSQLESVMISQDLMKFVDGSGEAPSEMIKRNDKDELNPEFAAWRKSDQLVLSWIKATVSEAVLGQIIRTHSAREAWVALEKSYGSPSPLRPTPTPRRRRPMMSMATFCAAPLMAAPTRKVKPPKIMDAFLPDTLVTAEAVKDATSPATYKDDVKSVRSWLSNLQYWFSWLASSCCLANTEGKKVFKNTSMEVTPPETPMS
ncbi:hypothetical protein EJ110_NYTH47963 [Nymphaea thermarum]|nr:hypothetical protein EJ110_NYTH47963 [Nymphaea thermarum]